MFEEYHVKISELKKCHLKMDKLYTVRNHSCFEMKPNYRLNLILNKDDASMEPQKVELKIGAGVFFFFIYLYFFFKSLFLVFLQADFC